MPRDVLVVAWWTILSAGVNVLVLGRHLEVLVSAPLDAVTHMRIVLGQVLISLVAGWRLLALRPWARAWLVLMAALEIAIFVSWPPGIGDLNRVWASLGRDGVQRILDARWIAELGLAITTLVVLGRTRTEIARLDRRAGALVAASVLVLAAYHVRQHRIGPRLVMESSGATPDDLRTRAVGEGTVRLAPTFRGRPIGALSSDQISLSVQAYDVQLGKRDGFVTRVFRKTLERRWHVDDGLIHIPDVPAGHYMVTLSIRHRDGGELYARSPHAFENAGGVVDVPVPLRMAIRVRQPRIPSDDPISHHSPMRIAWDSVPGATRYEATLLARDGHDGRIAELTEPEWLVDVPPGTWALEVDAIGDDGVIGTLRGEPSFVVGAPASGHSGTMR